MSLGSSETDGEFFFNVGESSVPWEDAVIVLPRTVDLCSFLEATTAVPSASSWSCTHGHRTSEEKGNQMRGDAHEILLLSVGSHREISLLQKAPEPKDNICT